MKYPNHLDNELKAKSETMQDADAVATPEPTAPTLRPPEVPEKFWDTATGQVKLDALLKSYAALERRLAAEDHDPETPAGREALLKRLGRPDTPEEYQLNLDGLPLAPDTEVNARLHAQGLTPTQVQAVYELAAERLVPLILDLQAQMQAEAELERLHDTFGGPEKWAQVARQLLAYGQRHLPPDVLRSLAGSRAGIMMLHDMMRGATRAEGGVPGQAVGDHDLKNLRAMMRDPKYWRERDPAFIARVSEGFARLYGGAEDHRA